MRFITACCLTIAILPAYSLAQENRPAQQANPAYDLWLVRSQTVTDDLVKDAAKLSPSEQALLWASLAQRWWRDNPEKARSWMLKAIETVENVPNEENPKERRERLSTARSLLKIITPVDRDLSKRLLAVLTKDAEHAAEAERGGNADGLIEAAVSLVNKDPQRAAELGALALRTGQPTDIASLLFALRSKDAKLADGLFAQALASAQQSLAGVLLNSLSYVAFPAERKIGGNIPVPPDTLRAELLELDIAFLQTNPIGTTDHNFTCTSVGAFIAPALSQFDRLLPQQAAIVRQFVNQCQSASPLTRQRLDDAQRDQPLKTVDDLLKAADDAQDLKVRTTYQYRAAALARDQQDYDRALKILDSMSKEAREFMGGSWEAYRWEWAAASASRHLKSGDVYGMRQVINAVPIELQAFAKIAFVSQIPDNRNKETDPTLEFLSDARTGLTHAGVSDAEKCTWYLGLLQLTVKYQPGDATAVLKEAVAALNRASEAKDMEEGSNGRRGLLESISSNLPASLLDMDEYAVTEAISSITAPDIRAQVRLDLLGACLARVRSLKQAAPNSAQTASKGE